MQKILKNTTETSIVIIRTVITYSSDTEACQGLHLLSQCDVM